MTARFALSRFVALLALVVGISASASVRDLPSGLSALPLAAITNDRDTSVSRLNLMLDRQETVRGIYMETRVPQKSAGAEDSKRVDARVFWLRNIEKPEGVVLGQGSGVKAILLSGTIDSNAGEGSLEIKYLSNGLLMNYHTCRLDLRRSGSRAWRLRNAYTGRPVTRIEVKTWMLGISTLKNVCPARATG